MKTTIPVMPTVPADDDFRSLLVCAVRYCLGRRTCMTAVVTGWIMHNCGGKLTRRDLMVMLNDIQETRDLGERIGQCAFGDSCDESTWETFEGWLGEEYQKAKT